MDTSTRNAEILEWRRQGSTLEQLSDKYGLPRREIQDILGEPHGRPCPDCKGDSKTLETRHRRAFTYRRHECLRCGARWCSRQFDFALRRPSDATGSVAT